MSKLIDKLKRTSQAVIQPMGFRSQQPASSKPEMLLIASLAQSDVDNPAEYVAGADAWVLPPDSKPSTKTSRSEKKPPAVSDIVQGRWLKSVTKESTSQILKAGHDFVIFPAAETPLASFQSDEPGTIMEVDMSTGEGLLRAINDIPVDAVLITGKEELNHLTWYHLMIFRRFANLLTKPLLALVPLDMTPDELQALWEADIRGVVIEIKAGQPSGKVKELRQMVDNLTPPPPHKRNKVEALLPRISSDTSTIAEEPVEDDEEDE